MPEWMTSIVRIYEEENIPEWITLIVRIYEEKIWKLKIVSAQIKKK